MSNKIPRNFIDDLLARIDIVEIIDSRVPLRKQGKDFSARCPFHDEKTPSFTVSQSKQFFHCFGCQKSGNAIGFLMEYDHMTFIEALKNLASIAGLELPNTTIKTKDSISYEPLYQVNQQASQYYQQQLRHHPQAKKAIEYLKQRGIDGNIAKQFAIGFAPSDWNNLTKSLNQPNLVNNLIAAGLLIQKDNGKSYDRFRERIMFPIRDNRGRHIGFGGRVIGDGLPKYLNSPETAIFHKGKELYGLYEARQANRHLENLIIVEGYMDVIALAQNSITNAVATLGTATTTEHLQQLFRLCQSIIFCFDGDSAGKQAAWRALETTLPIAKAEMDIRFMFLPDKTDPDSYVRQFGAEQFNQEVSKAIPLTEFFFSKLRHDIDIYSMDGTAKLIAMANPLINKVPSRILQHMMLDKLAQIAHLNIHQLKQFGIDQKSDRPQSRNKNNKQSLPPSNMKLLIALLIQHPQLAQYAPDTSQIRQIQAVGLPILLEILEILDKDPTITTGSLIEHWRGKDHEKIILQLAQWEHCVPDEGLEIECQDAFKRLGKLAENQKMEILMQKANQQGLSVEEKYELQELLKQQSASD